MTDRKKQANLLRLFRKAHRKTGAFLFIFFFIVSITSLLLGWKKNSYGFILPETETGVSSDLKDWMSIDALQTIAFNTLENSIDKNIKLELNRIDIRPDKGVAKFNFENDYWEVQLDGATGKVLAVSKRNSDLIENIHDGSILDILFNTNSDILKLVYTTMMGTALLTFTITGFWLWYGPKRMRKENR
jgi:Trk-type K+ transport system membrane component